MRSTCFGNWVLRREICDRVVAGLCDRGELSVKIALIGSGNMSRVLAGAWASVGEHVLIGSRDPKRAEAVAREIGLGVRGVGNDQAADEAEIVVYGVRERPSTVLRSLACLDGKPLVDINNRAFKRSIDPNDYLRPMALLHQDDAPRCHVIKALNNLAMEVFDASPEQVRAARIQTFIAGDHKDAKARVADLLSRLGLTVIDFGPSSNIWLLEMQADISRAVMASSGNLLMTPAFIEAPYAAPRFGARAKGVY